MPGRGNANIIRRIICRGSLICVVLMMIITQAALAASVPNEMTDFKDPKTLETSVDRARNGIVRILAGMEDDNGRITNTATLSGFIINNEGGEVLIVTTLHDVNLGDKGRIQVAVKNDSVVDAQIVQKNKENDFCILSAENSFKDKNEIPLRVDDYEPEANRLKEGDEVTALAFTAETGGFSDFRATDVSAAKGTISKTADENGGVIDHNASMSNSADGGVLVDKDGYAIGLLNPMIKASDNTVGAKDIREIDNLLAKAGLQYRSKDKDIMYSEIYNGWAEISSKYKRYDKETREQLPEAYKRALKVMGESYYDREALYGAYTEYLNITDNAQEKIPKSWLLVYALAAAIVLMLIRLITLSVWNRRNQPKAVTSGGIAAAAPAPQEHPAPSHMSGIRTGLPNHSSLTRAKLINLRTGMTMSIDSGSVILGRSTEADFVISGNNKVGRKHASIESRGSNYFLRDLNSTNGTYLNNRRVDVGGAILHSGDIIILGGEQIEFIHG